jgi:F-type H+-transporting ATPase subunit epsilon
MAEFILEMFTPEKQFFLGKAESFVCTLADGELCVLAGHQPLLAALSPGEVRLKVGGEVKTAYVADGFMEVRPDHVMVFSHICEWPEDIDEARTKREIEKDKEQLRNAESLSEHRRSEIELQRMMAMLKVKNRKTNRK